MTSPLFLAIDTTHLDAALTLAQKVRRHVGGLKLGLEFFCANGHHGVHEMAKLGLPIFLDLKLHDIQHGRKGDPGAASARTRGSDRSCRRRPCDA